MRLWITKWTFKQGTEPFTGHTLQQEAENSDAVQKSNNYDMTKQSYFFMSKRLQLTYIHNPYNCLQNETLLCTWSKFEFLVLSKNT